MYTLYVFEASSVNQNVSAWDVTNMSQMFYRASLLFNQGLSEWDVSNITNMGRMFLEVFSFNQDVSGWDVSNVTSSFNQDVSGWDVSRVSVMNEIFLGAANLVCHRIFQGISVTYMRRRLRCQVFAACFNC